MAARTVRCFVTIIFQCVLLTDSSQVSGLARLHLQRSQAGVQQGSDCFDLYYKFPSICYDHFELEFLDVF